MKTASRLILNLAPPKPVVAIQTFTCNLLPSSVRFDTLEGKNYHVVPMVMLTEGVHAGSNGPLLYSKEELEKTPQVWNHKPLVLYHPEMNGQGVSACDPTILNNRKFGVIMNAKFEKGRLKAEGWVDADRANVIDERIMAAITKNEMMELSTGLFCDVEDTTGDWNGEAYTGIARNFRPDHLAVLPDKIGACSIADGAGFLRNQAGGQEAWAGLKGLLRKVGLLRNEMSYSNVEASLRELIRAKLGFNSENGPWVWIADVYSNFFIYEVDGKLFRLGYSTSDTGVTLGDADPVEVRRVTEYRTVAGAFVGNQDQPKEQEDTTMNKTSMIVAILAANAGWSETDRPVLENMNDKQISTLHKQIVGNTAPPAAPAPALAAVVPSAPAPAAAPAAPAPVATTNATPAPAPVIPASVDDYLKTVPAQFRDVLTNSVALHNEEKARLVEAVFNSPNNSFTKEDLGNRPLGELRSIARLAGVFSQAPAAAAPSYAGMAPVPVTGNAGTEEAMDLPTMTFDKK